ncbi:MAG: sigma factor-like helix-turn-helix DNA-binding protein [bacterium]|nr:sigma factor-like helix-turn-helix DNA-binding protein [bacterium]
MPGHKILDEVLHTQKESDLQAFEPARQVQELLESLDSRAKNVIQKRFALDGGKPKTLESLGKNYAITRERVRQIENLSIKQLKKGSTQQVAQVNKILNVVLSEAGGVMEQEVLLDALLGDDKTSTGNRAALLFLLILSDEVTLFKETSRFKNLWASSRAAHERLQNSIKEIEQVLLANAKSLVLTELVTKLATAGSNLNETEVRAAVAASKSISQNPFGEYGLVTWNEIVPKGVRDKAYLVVRREGQPMHFLKITEKINATKFDSRTAYPQTVHNELIKDKRFVLVGRGMYALKEWGYQPGTVAEVLTDILKEHGEPMERQQLLQEVMKRRIVKRNTVLIGLQDKTHFVRLDGQRYDLVSR